MRPELQAYLQRKFPKLYTTTQDKNDSFSQWGFECGDGWFRLLLWLSRYLQNYLDLQNKMAEKYPDNYPKIDQVRVEQVKEKFGTLRFYTQGGNDRTQSVISFAEYISGFCCEYTGKTEDVGYNKKGWIKTAHKSFGKKNDFYYIDDEELRSLLKGQPTDVQLEFNFAENKKD